jgi:hypothetical protein
MSRRERRCSKGGNEKLAGDIQRHPYGYGKKDAHNDEVEIVINNKLGIHLYSDDI